MLKLELC